MRSTAARALRPLHPALFAAWAACACNLYGGVDHDGDYTFLPNSPRADTAPRALRRLLIVEGDASLSARRYYYFTGDLGALGLGIESLPHVLAREGQFSLLFENPFSALDAEDTSSAGGAPGSAPSPSAAALTLEVDGAFIPVERLRSADLARVGASRFVGALESGDFSAEAFIGREPSAAAWAQVRVAEPSLEPLELQGELLPAEPSTFGAEDGLELVPGPLARPDYLVIDLYQKLTTVEDDRPLEAVLRISIAPETKYVAAAAVLSTAFDSLCWSKDEPLFARITQVARSMPTPPADSALVERRADTVQVASEAWSDLVTEGETRAYCSGYR